MTQHTHDEVIAWIDDKIAKFKLAQRQSANNNEHEWWEISIASLLANRAGLERHKPQEHCKNPNCTGSVCSECGSKETVQIGFPCSTYTDIYGPIVSVM